jgi:hypothetical protein
MSTKNDLIMSNKVFIWIAAVTGLILSIPAIAMQFTGEVAWGPEDFIVMTILLFGMGSLFVLVARVIPGKYRALMGVAFLLAILTIWVHLAVGIVDTWPFAGS